MLSYSLVLALFLLGPGFATYAGIFFGFQSGRFQAAPPPPNSIFSFAVVGMSALFWPAILAVILALNDGLCSSSSACLAVPFEPDIYAAALASTHNPGTALSGAELAAFLVSCVLLSAAAFVSSGALTRVPSIAEALRRPLYGLYAGLVKETSGAASHADGLYVTAYVLTDMQQGGAWLGYVGVLENLQAGYDKQVAGVALLECNTFLLKLEPTVQRTPDLRVAPIDRIIIDGGRIQNIAFQVVELGDFTAAGTRGSSATG